MAIKKTELYRSLWDACDELRGGMDASQYKNYVLVMLFWRYVSDKAKQDSRSLQKIPPGASFSDLGSLKNQSDMGDRMNKAIEALAKKNDLSGVIDVVDFNDEEKLGKGNAKVKTLTNLVSIFENDDLDFSKNRAGGDDLLGDAYEYLMMKFATESGKSKGQFYTPAEVSRILAAVLEVDVNKGGQTIYDPTCGSGSLLLKVGDLIEKTVTLYGQEKDVSTAALAKMNTILHGSDTVDIGRGNSTLAEPRWTEDGVRLKKFDYVVANPPFSLKNWTNDVDPENDKFGRFTGFGVPPQKNGDYAFLLHIVASLKTHGKAAVILPHGVLFRGNAEEDIRTELVKRGLIKGIIGLPANLFYGTGIPACIVVLDKEGAKERKDIFMVNAAEGFVKNGNKNRLRERDIRLIIDTFTSRSELPRYSRSVPIEEIASEKNGYNLNLPRYIDMQEEEDIQDIDAHLNGGIPLRDLDALERFWKAFPGMRKELFGSLREGYSTPLKGKRELRETISSHPEFLKFQQNLTTVFGAWKAGVKGQLESLDVGAHPKKVLGTMAEALMRNFDNMALLDKYDMYQHLMEYWDVTLQDDLYLIAQDGWKAEPYRVFKKDKDKKKDIGWACDLVPKDIVIGAYFADEQRALSTLEGELEAAEEAFDAFEEEHSAEGGALTDLEKISKGNVQKALKEAKKTAVADEEAVIFQEYLSLYERKAKLKKDIKSKRVELDTAALSKYPELSPEDIKKLVIEDKWFASLESAVNKEMRGISQRLTERLTELMERYESTLPEIESELAELNKKVRGHLEKMGFSWS